MIGRMFFIGVGGSGGTTLRYLWRELEDVLRAYGEDKMPRAWQFLHIDAPTESDVIDADVANSMTRPENYLGLCLEDLKFPYYLNTIGNEFDLLAGWRPDPASSDVMPLWKGAGQRRAIGRVISAAKLADISTRIDSLVSQMNSKEADEDLRRLAGKMNTRIDNEVVPVLVSSLGGGSGSGMFLDVALLLKSKASAEAGFLANTINVLYTADIFSKLPSDKRVQIAANTMGAVSELISAHQAEGPLNIAEKRLLSRAGLSHDVLNQRVANVNFFISRQSMSDLNYSTSNEVYQVVARALTAFSMNEQLRDELHNRVRPNNLPLPGTLSVLHSGEPRQAASSFGYAVVGTGGQAFASYTAERVASQAVKMLTQDETEAANRKSVNRDDFLRRARQFAEAAGILELDGDDARPHDQILDALRGLEDFDGQAKSVADRVASEWSATTRKPADMASGLYNAFKSEQGRLVDEIGPKIANNAKLFGNKIQARLFEATLRFIASDGIYSVIEFLGQCEDDLREAAGQLETQAKSLGNQLRDEIQAKLQALSGTSGASSVSGGQNPLVREVLERFHNLIAARSQRAIEDMAAEVAKDIAENLLSPLADSLRRAAKELRNSLNDPKTQDFVNSWSRGEVAPHLMPTPNEIFLQDTGTFPGRFDDVLQKVFPDSPKPMDTAVAEVPMDTAVAEVLAGAWPDMVSDGLVQKRIRTGDSSVGSHSWIPSIAGSSTTGLVGQSLKTSPISFDPRELFRTAQEWAGRRNGVSRHLSESLADYLSDAALEAAGRTQDFVEKLGMAIDLAEPLVTFNASALRFFHGVNEATVRTAPVIGTIPLSRSSDAGKAVVSLLVERGMDRQDAERRLDPNSRTMEVEVARFVQRFAHPFTLNPVTSPILEQWGQAALSPSLRDEFWQTRRARHLASFIPMSSSGQMRLARGWQVARILGLVSDGDMSAFLASDGEHPIAIWSAEGYLTFPPPLITTPSPTPTDALPILMERFTLALLQASAGSTEGLMAFEELSRLGDPADRTLSEWVEHGSMPIPTKPGFSAILPEKATAGDASMTSTERRAIVMAKLQSRRDELGRIDQMAPRMDQFNLLTRSWELRQLLIAAIEQLMTSIDASSVSADVTLG
jgi:Tubulin like